MKPGLIRTLKSFLLEFVVYGVLVGAYFFLVLHFLGGWLKHLFDDDRKLYAFVAVGLMIGQGALLEWITDALMRAIRPRTK